jgi:hypothetical protein
MRAFAEELDALRQTASLQQGKPGQASLATSRDAPSPILYLQRTIGNRAIQRLFDAHPQTARAAGRVMLLRGPETIPVTQRVQRALGGNLPTLAVGASGPAVVELQERLTGVGHPLEADGQFGPRTRERR